MLGMKHRSSSRLGKYSISWVTSPSVLNVLNVNRSSCLFVLCISVPQDSILEQRRGLPKAMLSKAGVNLQIQLWASFRKQKPKRKGGAASVQRWAEQTCGKTPDPSAQTSSFLLSATTAWDNCSLPNLQGGCSRWWGEIWFLPSNSLCASLATGEQGPCREPGPVIGWIPKLLANILGCFSDRSTRTSELPG